MMRSCKQGFRNLGFFRQVGFAMALAFPIWFCSVALATQSVSVGWNAGTDPGIAGYALYYGTTNGAYSTRVDVGTNLSAVVSGLVAGQTNYFAVAAYNAANMEGTASTALAYIVPGYLKMSSGSVASLTFPVSPGHWYAVEATTNFTSWTNIWQSSTATSNAWLSYQDPQAASYPRRFYRLILH
jgi:hypothetical protein